MTMGWPAPPRCENCGGEQYRTVACHACAFPVFGMLAGMRMLARGLIAHYGHDPDEYPGLADELEQIVGDELLTMGREALAAHGLVPGGESTAPVITGGTDRRDD